MNHWILLLACLIAAQHSCAAADNELTEAERKEGWLLLFDGKTTAGWMNSDRTAPRTPVQDGALNPHKAGHYMLVHTQQWENFVVDQTGKLFGRIGLQFHGNKASKHLCLLHC